MATRKKGSTGKGKGRGKAASGAPRIDAKSLYSGTHSLGEQATRWLEERRKTGGEQQDINLELEEKACKCINDFEKSNDNLFRFRSSIIRKYDGENEKTPAFRTAGDEVAQLERMAREGSVLASCFVAERMLWDLWTSLRLTGMGTSECRWTEDRGGNYRSFWGSVELSLDTCMPSVVRIATFL